MYKFLYKIYVTKNGGYDGMGFIENKAEYLIIYPDTKQKDFICTWTVGFIIKF